VKLQSNGFSVWLDAFDPPPATEWEMTIRNSLDTCSAFVLILSPSVPQSSYVQFEISQAMERGYPIVVVRKDNTPIPHNLDCEQYFDFREPLSEPIQDLTEYLQWATSNEWEEIGEALKQAAAHIIPEDEIGSSNQFGQLVRHRLNELRWSETEFADRVELDYDFARAILDGEFPVEELGEAFVTELADIIELDAVEMSLLFHSYPQPSTASMLKLEANILKVIEQFWLLLISLFQAVDERYRTPLLFRRASNTCREHLFAYWKVANDPLIAPSQERVLLRSYFELHTHLDTIEKQLDSVADWQRLQVRLRFVEFRDGFESVNSWHTVKLYCLDNPKQAAFDLLDYRDVTPLYLLERLRKLWLAALMNEELAANRRIDTGFALGKLQLDDRRGVGVINNIPDIVWYKLPGHKITTEPQLQTQYQGFSISRYLVTFRQFEAFVDDSGYEEKQFWSDDAWQWKGERRHPTYFWNNPNYHIDNYPVVGISWYEALAFCKWLNLKLDLQEGRIRLPTIQEWETVASENNRTYSWGDPINSSWANYIRLTSAASSAIANVATIAVGICSGKDHELADGMDMAGNVWEWCLSISKTSSESLVAKPVLYKYGATKQKIRTTLPANPRQPILTGFRLYLTDSDTPRSMKLAGIG